MRAKGGQPMLVALTTLFLLGHHVESQTTSTAASTVAATTAAPTTSFETTAAPTTSFQTTAAPPTTSFQTTAAPPTTSFQTTAAPTTSFQTTAAPPTTSFQTTAAPPTCQAYTVDRTARCSSVATMKLDSALASGLPDAQACGYPLQQYACSTENVTSHTLAAILQCAITDPSSQATQADFVLLCSRLTIGTVREALDLLNTQISGANITLQGKDFMLKAVWENIKNDPQLLTSGFLASWLQERMHVFMSAINMNILNCLSSGPLTCDGMETVVQAMDIVYNNLDNSTKSNIVNWIQSFLISHNGCSRPSTSEWISSYWKNFQNDASYYNYVQSWSGFDPVASLAVLTASQVAEYTVASSALSTENSSAAIITTLSNKGTEYILSFLDHLQTLTPTKPFNHKVLHSLLQLTLKKVNENFPEVCVTSLKMLFQVHMKALLVAIDKATLQLIPTEIGCSDFHDICGGLDAVHDSLDAGQQQDVFEYRLQFLNKMASTDGSACTFVAGDSTAWLQLNFGAYSNLVNYSDIMRLNPGFLGYQVLQLLSENQIVDLLMYSKILTNGSVQNADININSVMVTLSNRGFVRLTAFMDRLHTVIIQQKITVIQSNVQCRMLQTIWTMLVSQFSTFNGTDVDVWFNDRLTPFFSCITSGQLAQLALQQDCTRLHTIVKGFSSAFAYMDLVTKTAVSDWIVGILNTTTGCPSVNWLIDNFQSFSGIVTVKQITSINPAFNLLGAVWNLTAVQIGEAVLVIPNALSSPDIMQEIFDAVIDVPKTEMLNTLGLFWDSFNNAFAEMPTIQPPVQYVMLERTTEMLSDYYSNMTNTEFGLWFDGRFQLVMASINSTILAQIPRTISCDKYRSLISGISKVYAESSNKGDVFDFIDSYLSQSSGAVGVQCSANVSSADWLEMYLGNFSKQAIYLQLKKYKPDFNVYEGQVLHSLKLSQVSQMIVYSGTLTNLNYTTQLFKYFGTLSRSDLHTCMRNFTTIANTQTILNITNEVGQYFIGHYMLLVQSEFNTYRQSDWTWLLENELNIFLPYISNETLALIIPYDCGSLFAIVGQLDTAFAKMPSQTQKWVVAWMVNLLSATSPNKQLSGCRGNYSQTDWVATFWHQFISVATIQQITATFPGFDLSAALPLLTTEQKIQYVMASNALTNVTTMQTVLTSLTIGGVGGQMSLKTADNFLTLLNAEIVKNPEIVISNNVKQQILTVFLNRISMDFSSFTTADYTHYFQSQLSFFLPSINVDLIQLLRVDISCNSYSAIMTAFDGIFSKVNDDNKVAISSFITRFLQSQQSSGGAGGDVCSNLYTDSRSYMLNLYFSFRGYIPITIFQTYYRTFDAFSVLDLFSPGQLADLMVVYALRDELSAAPIIKQVKGFTYIQVKEFMGEFNKEAAQYNVTVLPDVNIQNLLLKNVYNIMVQGISTPADNELWFGVYLKLFISSISTDQIMSFPTDSGCQSQESLTKGFGKVFHKLTVDQGKAVHSKTVKFLKTHGAECDQSLNSTTWISTWFGPFKEYATIAEYKSLNSKFDAASDLPSCTATQIGEYAETSGAINNAENFITLFGYLGSKEDVSSFMTELNTNAQSQLEGTSIGSVIMSCVSQVISPQYATFSEDDWTFWFQAEFRYILSSVNETILSQIPSNITCGSQQKIVKGLNSAYAKMTDNTRKVTYNFIKRFFTSRSSPAGIICGTAAQMTQEWLDINFGQFYGWANYMDLLQWNKYFMGGDVLLRLSFAQLADYTLQANILTDDDKICPVLARLHKQPPSAIYEYLDEFYLSATMMNFTGFPNVDIRKKMFVQFINDTAGQFSTFTSQDCATFFGSRVSLFLGSLDGSTAGTITTNMNCGNYRTFVADSNPVYSLLSSTDQSQIFTALYSFLIRQFNTTGSACPKTGEGDNEWLQGVLGGFASLATYNQIIAISPAFNGSAVLQNLSSGQLSGLCFAGSNFNSLSTIQTIVQGLGARSDQDAQVFATQFQNTAIQKGVFTLQNPMVRDELFKAIVPRISKRFSAFTANDWNTFLNSVTLMTASFNATSLGWIPTNIPCSIFQSIISALNKSFKDMPATSQEDVYTFAKNYLSAQSKMPGGNACTGNQGSAQWLQVNFGSCSKFATYDDLMTLNPFFSASLSLGVLSAAQRAQYTVKECLQSSDAATKVISSLDSTEVGVFLDEFNSQVQKQGLTKLSNANVRRVILGDLFCGLGSQLATFTTADYKDWFNNKLSLFIMSLDVKSMGFLPTDISCDSLAAIVNALSNTSVKYEKSEDIYGYIVSVLKKQQVDSGSACLAGVSTDRQWLVTYFGGFSGYATDQDFISFKSDFTGEGCSDLLSASQLAGLTVHSSTIYNISSIQLVFDSKQMSGDLEALRIFLTTLRSYSMQDSNLFSNTKISETFLMNTLEILAPKFNGMPLANVTSWLNLMDFMLPSINRTMLELFPLTMSCSVYQTLVTAFDPLFTKLSKKQTAAISQFMIKYLSAQAASDGSACASGITTTGDWIAKNLGHYCQLINATVLRNMYEGFNSVSYNGICVLPTM